MFKSLFGGIRTRLSKKSKDFVELSRLRRKKEQQQDEIDEMMFMLGEEVYKGYKDDFPNGDKITEVCDEIGRLEQKIVELDREIEVQKTKKYVCPKPSCEAIFTPDFDFCKYCGAKLKRLNITEEEASDDIGSIVDEEIGGDIKESEEENSLSSTGENEEEVKVH